MPPTYSDEGHPHLLGPITLAMVLLRSGSFARRGQVEREEVAKVSISDLLKAISLAF